MRILVVEDDESVATGVRRGLEAEGFDVEVAREGTTGLSSARSGRFDLLVLDVMLPGLNGYRLCRALRNDGDWTPVLMLSAKDGEYDQAEGLELGADDYLTKPFSMVVLVARVRALLRRPGRGAAPAAGHLRLDPVTRRCSVTGSADASAVGSPATPAEVALTAREAELLTFLLNRPDVVHRKADLLTAVWGADFAGDPNIVEVYVSHLRRKLDEPFGCSAFETVRGEGYRLRVDP